MDESCLRKNIAVIGTGFVGHAVCEGMKHACDVYAYDKVREDRRNCTTLAEAIGKARIVFVCVPTPMKPSGECCTDIVEEVVEEIYSASYGWAKGPKIVVIKSTVPPGTTARLAEEYGKRGDWFHVAFNPEFLREATYIEDFKNQDHIVIGTTSEYAMTRVSELYHVAYPGVRQIHTDPTTAEMRKYIANCFLATKVSFANEMYQICQALGVDYDKLIEIAKLDKRLGDWGWKVPGYDNIAGWSLSCFPKDLNALIYRARELGIDPKMMAAAWWKNIEVRPQEHCDWERMTKAVTNVKK